MGVPAELQIPVCDTCNIPLTDAPVDAVTASQALQFHWQTEHDDNKFFARHNLPPEESLQGDPITATSSVFVAKEDWGSRPYVNKDKPKGNGRFPKSKFH